MTINNILDKGQLLHVIFENDYDGLSPYFILWALSPPPYNTL